MRHYSLLDRVLGHINKSLKVMTVPAVAQRPLNLDNINDKALSTHEKHASACLMRVNHAGEIAAQGLYLGQAFSADKASTAKKLRAMADEESDHLAWCEQRLNELQSHASLLAPFWYIGSLGIGAAAGCLGDRYSFGFVKETEGQVIAHLDSHLDRISPKDTRTIALIQQIKEDEARHAQQAEQTGCSELPYPIKHLMRATAKIMTRTAHCI